MALAEASDTAAAERASGSSFYNAMRVLPRAQREATFAIHSSRRQVADNADSRGARRVRREQLLRWRDDIDALYAGKASQFIETQVKFEDGRTGKVAADLVIRDVKTYPVAERKAA